jgi:hypothetical protein
MVEPGLSIKVKLPLLIGGLLVTVAAIYSAAAYERMRASSRAAATSRLATVADQYAQALRTQRDQIVAGAISVAESPAVRAYAAHPSAGGRAAAEAALRPIGLQAPQLVAVELWSADRRRSLAVGEPDRWGSPAAVAELVRALAGADSGVVGRFRAVGDSIVYPVGARVITPRTAASYLVQWRLVTLSPQAREQVSRLIGSNGRPWRWGIATPCCATNGPAALSWPPPAPRRGPRGSSWWNFRATPPSLPRGSCCAR